MMMITILPICQSKSCQFRTSKLCCRLCQFRNIRINKIISVVAASSFILPFNERIFESTLAFRKSYWLENKFDSSSKNEGKGFLKNGIKI